MSTPITVPRSSSGTDDLHLRTATIFGQHASVALRNAQLTTKLREHGLMKSDGN